MASLLIAAFLIVGCGRSADEQNQNLQPPTLPSPSQPLPDDTGTGTGTGTGNGGSNNLGSNNLGGNITNTLGACAQHWDPYALYQLMYGAYHTGFYSPFSYGGGSIVTPRGLKGNAQRGLGCANDLMQYGYLLHQLAGYYQPGILDSYLWNVFSWGYPGYFGYGYPYGYGSAVRPY